jgi:isoamylase
MSGWDAVEGAILSLGSAWIEEESVYNFSLYSRHASQVTLLLFGEEDAVRPTVKVIFDPRHNKTWDVWHCRLREHEVAGARYYAYQAGLGRCF